MQLAHGVGIGREDLPIPVEPFTAGAITMLVVSFLGLATLWRRLARWRRSRATAWRPLSSPSAELRSHSAPSLRYVRP